MVEATDVDKWFGHLHVLQKVSLTVWPREVVVIIGPSGSGKSTFLRCVNHLEKIDGGSLTVNGHPIGYRTRRGRLVEDRERRIAVQRRDVGMVFQRFNLFPHMTSLENVTAAPIHVLGTDRREAEELGRSLLARVGLEREGRLLPRPPLRRTAAARRDRARARDEARADALRRGDERARPRDDRRGARRDEGARAGRA